MKHISVIYFNLCFIKHQKCGRLYTSTPLGKDIDLKQRLEKKLNDASSFINYINNIKKRLNTLKIKQQIQKKNEK